MAPTTASKASNKAFKVVDFEELKMFVEEFLYFCYNDVSYNYSIRC